MFISIAYHKIYLCSLNDKILLVKGKIMKTKKTILILIFLQSFLFFISPLYSDDIPEPDYSTSLIKFPGPWQFQLPKAGIILVRDDELDTLCNPDAEINISVTREPNITTLRKICENAQARGVRTLTIAFDHFFAQYRPGQNKPREWTPDKTEYIERIAKISQFAQSYGLGLDLSFLTPLELGTEYRKETGECGVWMHFGKGLRDPDTGKYSIELWRQERWANNKGPIDIEFAGVRVFAFNEDTFGREYKVVVPSQMVEISETAQIEEYPSLKTKHGDFTATRIRIYGSGAVEKTKANRILVVIHYKTPEMDYFSENALPYLKSLCDRYINAGVKINALYSDEMHIQQDWAYFNHHDLGSFALRYVSPGFQKAFAQKYGEQYADLAPYMIYFVQGQDVFSDDLFAHEPIQHIISPGREGIIKTALFRAQYYHFLHNGVVDLFTQAKKYLEQNVGYKLEARAHATWAESPTCDLWRTERCLYRLNYVYEYTSNFMWSNTVHQASSACHDYFKWGDFLTGNGNDTAEGGFLDRNYYGLALGASTGVINDVPNSYSAHWGMPHEIADRRQAVCDIYGNAPWLPFALVEDYEHRDTDVLFLYPIDLVAFDERFGSLTIQYGYGNYITAEKLIELGSFDNGICRVKNRSYKTLVALFEPTPPEGLLEKLSTFVENGGNLIWIGPPPYFDFVGNFILDKWQNVMGVNYLPTRFYGYSAVGMDIEFTGPLAHLSPMTVLTDFPIDSIYPIQPLENTTIIATCKGNTVGTYKEINKGKAVYLGFRPRDNQSASLGKETRWLFDILSAMNAYPPSGIFNNYNDNPDYLSRNNPYMFTRFPNGTIAVAPHYKDIEEGWEGGFARNREKDEQIVKELNLKPNVIELTDFKVWGHTVTYQGNRAMAFRTVDGQLLAFAGSGSKEINIDGKTFTFADNPVHHIAWAPVPQNRYVKNGAVATILINGNGNAYIPFKAPQNKPFEIIAEGTTPGSPGEKIPFEYSETEEKLTIALTPASINKLLYIVPLSQ